MHQDPLLTAVRKYAEAGFSVFKLNGKIPAAKGVDWSKTEYLFPDQITEWTGNIGVVLSRRDLVIDVDPRNFKEGDKPHVRLFKDSEVDIKSLGAIVRTGGGGVHIYLRLPDEKSARKIRKKVAAYPGIDFLSSGSYVVGAGSVHPDTGKSYEWAGGLDLGEIKMCPEHLRSLCGTTTSITDLKPEAAQATQAQREGVSDSEPEVAERYAEFLRTAPVAVQGENGDHTTFAVACKGRDLGLSRGKTFALMLQHYNHRCTPDWAPEELKTKVRNAFQYAAGQAGGDLPEEQFTKVVDENEKHPLFTGWDRTTNGKLAKTLNNTFNYFIISDSPLKDTIAYDEFYGQVRIVKALPWMPQIPASGAEWSDGDSVQLRLWLSRVRQFDLPVQVVDQAVLAAAQLKILHPVKDYLNSLKWDGVSRLEKWLIDCAGAEDNKFVREVSKKFMLQAVNRVYQPGCKADYVIVLEGEQGVGKSSIVRILGGKWYGDILIDPHSRDTVDAMRGRWFIEFSEMEAQNRHDAQAMKAFITRQVDRVRLAYGRRAIDLPRQCVFMGTMNPDATGEYLNDTTGNRRIWPVEVGRVKFAMLEALRDQLFAEAAQMVLSGEATHIIDQEIIAHAVREQRARQTTDPWSEIVAEFISKDPPDFITTKDVWVYALKGSESTLNNGHQKRIAVCLKDCGYSPALQRFGKQVVRGFQSKLVAETKELL